VFGIKPFADNSLFAETARQMGRMPPTTTGARGLASGTFCRTPPFTAPIPGLMNIHQRDNAVRR